MTYRYQVSPPTALSASMIQTILNLWQIPAWKGMDTETFRQQFSQSEFHLLTHAVEGTLQCIARINHAFTLKIGEEKHGFAELVGLVAARQGRGSGKVLMSKISRNLKDRNIQALGFCSQALRPFYEKCGVTILQNRAHYIYEKSDTEWVPADDDDILDINLSFGNRALLRALNEHNVAYYIA